MKYSHLFLPLLALLFLQAASVAEAKSIQDMAEVIKNPVTLKASTSHLLNVTFNHTSHRGINCFACHHAASEKKGRYVSCSECHAQKGRSSEPLSTFAAFHAKESKHSCYSCHLSKSLEAPKTYGKHFYNCRPCHYGPQAKSTAQK
ncbi:MAG: cytochrome c3 family protein [Desulfovibrio sp.]|nr:cytochrome c3 family protein [Desulfovibrio sp.]